MHVFANPTVSVDDWDQLLKKKDWLKEEIMENPAEWHDKDDLEARSHSRFTVQDRVNTSGIEGTESSDDSDDDSEGSDVDEDD